jgi:hypothetical protein
LSEERDEPQARFGTRLALSEKTGATIASFRPTASLMGQVWWAKNIANSTSAGDVERAAPALFSNVASDLILKCEAYPHARGRSILIEQSGLLTPKIDPAWGVENSLCRIAGMAKALLIPA